MRIRHLTSQSNVDADGSLLDPAQVRHGIVVAGRIADLAAPVDPLTHLNRDFPEHGLDDCVVAEALAVGARVLWDGDGMWVARARPSAYTPLGRPRRAPAAAGERLGT